MSLAYRRTDLTHMLPMYSIDLWHYKFFINYATKLKNSFFNLLAFLRIHFEFKNPNSEKLNFIFKEFVFFTYLSIDNEDEAVKRVLDGCEPITIDSHNSPEGSIIAESVGFIRKMKWNFFAR